MRGLLPRLPAKRSSERDERTHLSYRRTHPVSGGRRDRRQRTTSRTRTLRQVGVTTAIVAFAVGSFASAGANTLDSSADKNLAAQDLAAVVNPVAADESDVEVTTETVENELEFDSVEKDDSSIEKGTKKVVTPGKDGSELVSYTVKKVDGVEVEREESLRVLVDEPTDEVIAIGTKTEPKVAYVPVTSNSGSNRALGKSMAASMYGWTGEQWECLNALFTKESNWRTGAANPSSSAYGIPQALPGSKMSSAGSDWRTNPATQIKWGLGYIKGRYGTPCGGWAHSVNVGWY